MPKSNFISAFSKRKQGNMSLVYGDTSAALANRRDFLGKLGIDYRHSVCAEQAHSNLVSYVKEEDRGKGALDYTSAIPGADGLVTDKKGLPLAILTADCLSVFLYDPQVPAAGIVHAGWRGTKAEITTQAIKLMRKQFNTRPKNLKLIFGPSIRSCCYEVDRDLESAFRGKLAKRGNRLFLDLAALNKREALDAGVGEKNILDSGVCTICRNEEFFSFRREGDASGRMISVVMLR
ncbi:MAG: peptidoglycan editing factor PgeF [Candidatus Omnitrophota bacterium]|nr:peptidoglycan editing factor PgeF [Candidatus Omnitrophota bacterium]